VEAKAGVKCPASTCYKAPSELKPSPLVFGIAWPINVALLIGVARLLSVTWSIGFVVRCNLRAVIPAGPSASGLGTVGVSHAGSEDQHHCGQRCHEYFQLLRSH
jgi:hypothetical protein